MSFLTGGSKSTSENQAYPWLQDTYAPQAEGGVDAFGLLSGLLGAGGDQEAAQGGFQNFLDNSGFGWAMDEAMRGVSNSGAGKFLLRSGATAKALQNRATGLGQQFFGNYLNQVGNLANLGINAGQLISGAGQVQKEKSSNGLLGGLGTAAVGAAKLPIWSDRRLKTDIERVGELGNGLPWYKFRYVWDMPSESLREGLMSDDVRAFRPQAVVVDGVYGFDKVIYPVAMAL